MLWTTAGWVFCAAALAGSAYAVACSFAVQRFARLRPTPAVPVPVTVLKPLYRAEPLLLENLESLCRQDYRAPVQIVLGVHDTSDGAYPVAEQFRRLHPDADICIVTGAARRGANPKISNLMNMVSSAKHDLLVISDSDIGVPADYLSRISAAAELPGTGVVTCCYTGKPARPGLWPQLSAMAINQRFLPDVLFALSLGLASPCFGSTIALKRQVLAEIGGLCAFADRLADDYEIGRAVRARGYRIAVPPVMVSHCCPETGPGELIRHELRWARTIRLIDPAGYAGSAVTHALPLALAALILLGFSPVAMGVTAAALAARMWLAIHIRQCFGTRDPILLVPARDLLSFVIFIGALFASRVDWQGVRFRVDSAGAMAQE